LTNLDVKSCAAVLRVWAQVIATTTATINAAAKEAKMASEKQQNLQDSFLNHVRKQKVPVTIFLVNGVKLQGVITWFDNFCLLLRRDAQSQLVYKHAISTIMPGAPIQLFDPEQNNDHD
jgi:host factor-I protein